MQKSYNYEQKNFSLMYEYRFTADAWATVDYHYFCEGCGERVNRTVTIAVKRIVTRKKLEEAEKGYMISQAESALESALKDAQTDFESHLYGENYSHEAIDGKCRFCKQHQKWESLDKPAFIDKQRKYYYGQRKINYFKKNQFLPLLFMCVVLIAFGASILIRQWIPFVLFFALSPYAIKHFNIARKKDDELDNAAFHESDELAKKDWEAVYAEYPEEIFPIFDFKNIKKYSSTLTEKIDSGWTYS